MKVCPTCQLTNEERFPACLWCNTVLVNVRSIPSANPNDPEYHREKLASERRGITRRQLGFAAAAYVLATTLLAVYPGLVFSPPVLLLYTGTGLAVVIAVIHDWAGQFTATFLQGGLSLVLVLCYGPMQLLVLFMLMAHAILPMVYWHWANLIHEANR